ncbi:MAG TPA: putative metallopeptidase [Pyrinomonadaceae bacterium]|jgi:hypothetical protein
MKRVSSDNTSGGASTALAIIESGLPSHEPEEGLAIIEGVVEEEASNGSDRRRQLPPGVYAMGGETQDEEQKTVDAQPVDTAFPVPEEATFENKGEEFLPAPEIQTIAHNLISRFEEFRFLLKFTVNYYWKKSGGSTGGKRTYGKLIVPSGLLRTETETNFILWIAADNCRARFTHLQMEACVFHYLKHATRTEKGGPALRKPDWEGYAREVEEYGV